MRNKAPPVNPFQEYEPQLSTRFSNNMHSRKANSGIQLFRVNTKQE